LIEYDSCDPALTGLRQRFRPGPRQAISSTKTWKQVTWTLPHARFAGRANGADFRLSCVDEDLLVARVTVRRGEQGD
jgi:hypothetical protein